MRKLLSSKSAALALALSCAALSAQAATVRYQLDATAVSTNDDTTGFSIVFDDLDMDMLFSLDELVDFSGVTSFSFFGGDLFLPTLDRVPDRPNFTDGGSSRWEFLGTLGSAAARQRMASDQYTYILEPAPSQVPLPAGGLLLLTGLAGMAALRRRLA